MGEALPEVLAGEVGAFFPRLDAQGLCRLCMRLILCALKLLSAKCCARKRDQPRSTCSLSSSGEFTLFRSSIRLIADRCLSCSAKNIGLTLDML
jgi:hypothetical protein